MESQRQQKVARLLQKDISEILQIQGRNIFGSVMVTVTVVRVTPDLSTARVYLSIFSKDDKEKVLKQIRENTKEIRKILGTRIKNQVRVIPSLDFFIDDSLDEVFKIEELLKK